MAPDRKKPGKKKAKEMTENCKECEKEMDDDDDAMECDLCKDYVCLKCTGLPEEVYNYLAEKDVEMPYICRPCKAELPKVRELMGLKEKYEKLNGEMTQLRADLETQELKFTTQAENMRTLADRLATLEERNNQDFPHVLDANQPERLQQFVDHVRPVLHTEITEFDKIMAIKKNLVCSGIKESTKADTSEAEVDDRTAFINLIKDEFNIVADVEKVERCGKKKPPTDEDPSPNPRLLKVFMKDLRTRKLILSKAVTLRNSGNEHTSRNVYIRPDQTIKQQEESKNLRDQLKLKREQNHGKRFKIYQGKIVEVKEN